jgi:regulatory protein
MHQLMAWFICLSYFRLFMEKKKLTPAEALLKIQAFCAYQERSHSEVRDKLYSFGLFKSDVDQLITKLIDENYLSEERFARAYASGRFRIKNWGRTKIRHGLKLKGVSEYCIRKAMEEIDEEEYLEVLTKLIAKKLPGNRRSNPRERQKVIAYFMGRGFETELIMKITGGVDPD